MYNNFGYVRIINECGKLSMKRAAEEVKALPTYPEAGEVILVYWHYIYVNLF